MSHPVMQQVSWRAKLEVELGLRALVTSESSLSNNSSLADNLTQQQQQQQHEVHQTKDEMGGIPGMGLAAAAAAAAAALPQPLALSAGASMAPALLSYLPSMDTVQRLKALYCLPMAAVHGMSPSGTTTWQALLGGTSGIGGSLAYNSCRDMMPRKVSSDGLPPIPLFK
jgi:hypothetical protein